MTSLYLPTSPAPAAVRISSHQRTQTSQAASGKILSRKYGGQYYKMSLSYNPMRRDQCGPLIAFLEALEGRNKVFYVPVDQLTGGPGLAVGNYANVDNDDKLYMITGTEPLTLSPGSHGLAEPIDPQVLNASTPMLHCSLSGNVHTVALDRKGLIKIEIDLIERV